MKLIDTHSHLYLDAFDDDRQDAVLRARDAGVTLMLLPNVDVDTLPALAATVSANPGYCLPMMGLHPCSVKQDYQEQLGRIRQELEKGRYVAVGEIGIDMYWDRTFRGEQEEAFDLQLQWAEEFELPVAIHMRDSWEQIIDVLQSKPRPKLKGVFHCFTGSLEQANQVTDLGFHLGIGGVLTYKNSRLPEVLAQISPEWVVLETDAPYLAPVPHRGKRNESSYMAALLPLLAEAWSMSTEQVAAVTSANAERLFKLDKFLS